MPAPKQLSSGTCELTLLVLCAAGQSPGAGGFLAALSGRLQLPAAICAAASEGTLALDTAQRDYLSALLGSPLPEPGSVSSGGRSSAAAGNSSAGGVRGCTMAGSLRSQPCVAAAFLGIP